MANETEAAFSDLEDVESNYEMQSESDDDVDESPIDGYFTRRNHPRAFFVQPGQQPTLPHSADKASGGEQDSTASLAVATRLQQPLASPRIAGWEHDSAPILDAGPLSRPPPNYAAATAHREEEERHIRTQPRTSIEELDDADWHETFGSAHPLVRSGIVVERVAPTTEQHHLSVADHHVSAGAISPELDVEEGCEDSALMGGQSKKRLTRARQGGFGQFLRRNRCVIFLCVILLCAALSGFPTRRYKSRKSSPDATGTVAQLPHPTIPGCGWTQYETVSIDKDYWLWYPETKLNNVTRSGLQNFTFIERLPPAPDNLRLSGTLRTAVADEDQEHDVRFAIEVATTRDVLTGNINYNDHELGSVELTHPSLAVAQAQGCIDYSVTLFIRKATTVGNFNISASNFHIDLNGDGLFDQREDPWTHSRQSGFNINDTTILHAVRGNIKSQGWRSRRTDVYARTGSITGTWPLRSSLKLNTRDGDILVDVEPRKSTYQDKDLVRERNERIAEYTASSEQGHIRSRVVQAQDIGSVPDRDYITCIESQRGDISGDYLLGSDTTIKTNGTMNVRLVPVVSGHSTINVHTENDVGLAWLWVLQPVLPDRTAFDAAAGTDLFSAQRTLMNNFHATHASRKNGSINYILPLMFWAGTAELQSRSGQVIVDDEFEVVRNETSRVVAVREGGNSTIDIKTTAGWIRLDSYVDPTNSWESEELGERSVPQP